MDRSLPGSSVQVVLQARILEWVAVLSDVSSLLQFCAFLLIALIPSPFLYRSFEPKIWWTGEVCFIVYSFRGFLLFLSLRMVPLLFYLFILL